MEPNWPTISKRDILRALQACYYVLAVSIVEDTEFDMLQKEWEKETGKELPVGGDTKDSYTDTEWSLALYFAFKKAWADKGFKGSKIPPMNEKLNPKQAKVKKGLGLI